MRSVAAYVTRIDIWRIGHAMVRPTPGFLSSPTRRSRAADLDARLFYAHSDISGLPQQPDHQDCVF